MSLQAALPLIAVTGLKAEARIAAAVGVTTLSGGGDAARLALLLQAHLAQGARAVVSFGIAGGLAQGLEPGTVVVASGVSAGDHRWAADPAWRAALAATLPGALSGDIAGVDLPVVDATAKARLHGASGALAVDMESHVAARLAAQYQVPFAAVRVVADPATRGLPHAALVGMRPDGSTDVLAVLRTLARRPAELPGLIRTALDARAAFGALKACRGALGFAVPHAPADPIGGAASPRPTASMLAAAGRDTA